LPADLSLATCEACAGLGESATEHVAMRALNDSDALPVDDPELRSALSHPMAAAG